MSDGDWDGDYDWGDNWFPGAGMAIAGATAAIVGSYYNALPYGCSNYYYHASPYYSCGGAWYQPQYEGDDVTYIVVEAPQGDPDPGAPTVVQQMNIPPQ